MTKDYQEIEKIVEEFNKTFRGCDQCQYGDGQGTWMVEWLRTTLKEYGNARVEEIIKIAEGRQRSLFTSDKQKDAKNEYYNQALQDLIEALNK
jgi:hypothetical protein